MIDKYKDIYFDSLLELFPLYEKVRYAIILGENFDRNREMYVAPINQLRSALDHVFKAINCAENDKSRSAYELKEAKEHLDRAGYDALELLAGSLGTGIVEKLSSYKTSTLSTVFPKYYQEIKPSLSDIKENIAILRSKKNGNSGESFLAYFDHITKMVEMGKEVETMSPSLEEYEKKQRKEWWCSIIWKIGSAVIGGVLVYVFTSFL